MEFAAAAMEAIAASGAVAGAEVAGATASSISGAAATSSSLASALTSTSLWTSILAGGATVASVIGAQRAGEEKAASLELQADDAEMSARVEQVQGLERRTSIKKALLDAIGDRDVATAASGVDLSFGTPVVARRQAIKDSERALALDTATEEFRRSRLLERASSFRQMAISAREGGLVRAAGIGMAGASEQLRRGVPKYA